MVGAEMMVASNTVNPTGVREPVRHFQVPRYRYARREGLNETGCWLWELEGGGLELGEVLAQHG